MAKECFGCQKVFKGVDFIFKSPSREVYPYVYDGNDYFCYECAYEDAKENLNDDVLRYMGYQEVNLGDND